MAERRKPDGTDGAPPLEIDKEQFRKLVALGCTQDEIAAWFGVSTKTINRRINQDWQYAEIWETAKLKMKASLRHWQMKSAERGNASMLIWLGKVFLQQKDSVDITIQKPISEWTDEELRHAIRSAGGNPDEVIAGALAAKSAAGTPETQH